MKHALLLAALATTPAATATLTVQSGQWYSIFAPDVERVLGSSVRVDAASIAAGGLGRQFRQVAVLLWAQGAYPYGTAIYAERSVDCARGLQLTYRWSAVAPTGAVLDAQAYTSPQVAQIQWDSQDGRVFKFVCQGILSH